MAVLTKPDLVESGGKAKVMVVLDNFTKALKHGYFMLKNRSQKESDDSVSLEKSLAKEKAWFTKSKYAARKTFLGVKALTSVLKKILRRHIESALPALKKGVLFLLEEAEEELYDLGEAAPEDTRSYRIVLSKIKRKWNSSMGSVCALADYREL